MTWGEILPKWLTQNPKQLDSLIITACIVMLYMEESSLEIVVVGGSFAGIKMAWELRNRIHSRHKITLIAENGTTIFRPSFPRVVFDDAPLSQMTMDLARNFEGTGIDFVRDRLVHVDQAQNAILTEEGKRSFDYLVIATGARHAYEVVPGLREFAVPWCDASKIIDAKKRILDFREGEFYGGVGTGFTPADGPAMEVLFGLDHRLRKLGSRDKAKLTFVTDKGKLLPPGGPTTWKYLTNLFKERGVEALLNVDIVRLDAEYLHFEDGSKRSYDLCMLIPPYRGRPEVADSGLTDDNGFIPVEMNTMRASQSENGNVYAVGDGAATHAPKSAHIALMQADVAAAHMAWRINRGGVVPSYLPEFKFVMYLGGGESLYMYSQWMSDGDVEEASASREAETSKIEFERKFLERRGNVGQLHMQMIK